MIRTSRLRSVATTSVAAVLLSLAGTAGAQQGATTITGRVTAEDGTPLPGANVYITEMTISVGTGPTGAYTINIPAARVNGQTVQLRVRSVGFAPQAQAVTLTAGAQTHNFSLRRDALRLSEVVVTGVTAATEQIRVPFAVQRVDSTRMPVVGSNALSQLQGKVPGANIVAAGRPGAAPTIVLRGVTSINASGRSQSPLYIVDGVMLQGGLPDINPNDIENVEVVAGAAAASLYGPRAGTGVINITTKKGRAGEQGVRFGLRTELGAGDIERRWPSAQYTFLGMDPTGTQFCTREVVGGSPCARYIDIEQERRRVNDQPLDYSLPPQGFYKDYGISQAAPYANLTGLYQVNPWPKTYDPLDQLITNGAFSNVNLDARGSFSGGANFFASVGNTRETGAVRFLDGFRRNSGRLNVEQRLAQDKFTLGVNTYYARTWSDGANLDNTGSGGPWFTITRTPPFVDLLSRDSQGRLYIRSNPLAQGDQNGNPAYPIENIKEINRVGRFLGSLNTRYQPAEWFTLAGQFGFDRTQDSYSSLRDRGARSTANSPATANGAISEGSGDDQSLNTQLSASARKTFFNDLETTLNAQYLYNLRENSGISLSGSNIVVPGLYTSNAATEGFGIGSSRQQIREVGLLGGLNLAYKGRYIIDGALRHDGSSLFGPDNRWQTFGRISGTWIASEESWWFAPRALSLFKLRANYGASGVNPSFAAQYETFSIGTGGTLNPNTLGNRNLRPEVKTDIEVGADFELFGKAAFTFTYVDSKVDDQILPVRPPAGTGFSNQWQNAGQLSNKTIEASVDFPLLTRRDLNWTTRLIFDKTVTKVTRLDVPPFTGTITAANTYTIYQFREGERVGTFYGTKHVTECGQLPGNFASQCGGAGSAFQKNDMGYIVWVGAGNNQNEGISRNLWTTALPAAQSPWGVRANWGMPMVYRDSAAAPRFEALGNGIPDFHLGWSQNFTWKRLNVYGLLDANIGQEVWNIAYHWSLGDFTSAQQDQYGKSIEEAKPIGYYWRRGPGGPGGSSGVGGFYDVLGPTNFSVEDGTYAKIREVSVGYRVGKIGGVGDWTLGVVGRNLFTFTNFRGWDPEVGAPGGNLNSAALNAVAGYRFPNTRTFTLQVSSSF